MRATLGMGRFGLMGAALLAALMSSGCGGGDEAIGEPAASQDVASALEVERAKEIQAEAQPGMMKAQSVPNAAAGVLVVGFPVDHQLIPRAKIGDTTARTSFTVTSTSKDISSVTLTAALDGVQTSASTVALSLGRTVTINVPVPVGLQSSTYRLLTSSATSSSTEVMKAVDVVAGDVYVVQGQSNAKSTVHPDEDRDAIDPVVGRWIRTVGNLSDDTTISNADHAWYVARGGGDLTDTGDGSVAPSADVDTATVGKWPMQMAQDLVDRQQVPIAILNGAQGGKQVPYFLPKYKQQGDAANNYTRLMNRLNAYGLAKSVRAIFYYQGESDTVAIKTASSWSSNFKSLMYAWNASFPNLDHVYLTQIRGCIPNALSNYPGTSDVREQQRVFTLGAVARVQVMSTTAMPGFDGGCHFHNPGYQQLGHAYAALLLNDLYGQGGADVTAPAPTVAHVTPDGTTLSISVPKLAASLTVPPDSRLDFVVTTTKGIITQPIAVTAASREGLTLTLPAGVGMASKVSYRAPDTAGRPAITNSTGLGLVAFEGLPVTR